VRRILVALLISVVLQAVAIAAKFLLVPIHERGTAQVALSPVIAVADLVQAPGEMAVFHFQLFDRLHWLAWVLRISVNVLLGWAFFAILLGKSSSPARAERPTVKEPRPRSARADDAPVEHRVSRRSMLTTGLRVATVGGAALAGYGMFIDPFRLRVTRRTFPVRDLPRELDGLRIVQLTDIHHGPWFAMQHVREMVERTNALEADLICLTGDFVHRSPRYIEPLAGALADLRAKVGLVGVMGNHDWQEDAPLTQQAFARVGVRLLDNTRLFLTPDRKLRDSAGAGLCIAGVGDLWKDAQDYRAALGHLPDNMPRILMAHNPDTAEEPGLRAVPRVDLMLSGHTHGGQIYVPGIGTPVLPSRYGQKYARGLVQGPTCPVYVSCGVGIALLPLRIGVLPEIAVIELTPA
jgi:predicted MPP superfamily phosphohydrolase